METALNRAIDRDDDRLVYTVSEAGALLGISRAFAYELAAGHGGLPGFPTPVRGRLVPDLKQALRGRAK